MKSITLKTVLVILIYSAMTQMSVSQCYVPSLLTQADVDNFVAENPDCTETTGDLNIGSAALMWGISDIHDLSGLSNLTRINGDLYIRNVNSLLDVSGLENITYINEDLVVSENLLLRNISALGNLDTIGRDFYVSNNDSLETTAEFESLTSIGGSLVMTWNRNMKTIGSFEGITKLNGKLLLKFLPFVDDLSSLYNIQSVYYSLTIRGLGINNLIGLNSIQNLEGVDGYIYIADNPNLISLEGLNNLVSIDGSLILRDCPNLNSIKALETLNSIDSILIVENTGLVDIYGLQNASIGGGIKILINDELLNLNGISLGQLLSNDVIIEGNNKLTDVSALSPLDSILGDLKIVSNLTLEDCNPICRILGNGYINEDITISNNRTGCDSVEEILANDCTTSSIETEHELFHLSPNPVSDYLKIKYTGEKYDMLNSPMIYDLNGSKISPIIRSIKSNEIRLNVSNLENGIYFVLPNNNKSGVLRFIKT